jgi:TetR/AcrR family transcriptional regulator
MKTTIPAQPLQPGTTRNKQQQQAAAQTHAPREHRTRLKPGERRTQILQVLAIMLEAPLSEKITTATLAARVGVSEAALYRQFASKTQMFEGLLDFIEQTLFALINQIITRQPNGVLQARAIALMLLQFSTKNAGMTRVLTGEALVGEHARLTARTNQMMDRIETTLRQCLRIGLMQAHTQTLAGEQPSADTQSGTVPLPEDYDPVQRAGLIICYVTGCWQRYIRSGFKRKPGEHADELLRVMLQ